MKAVIRDRGRNYITPTVTAVGTTETEFTVMITSTITAGFFQIRIGRHRRLPDHIVADAAFQSSTAEDLTGSDIGISESISVITNIKHRPATTPTRRSKPGLIESGH